MVFYTMVPMCSQVDPVVNHDWNEDESHPGAESFDGEIARFLIYEKPLSDHEFKKVVKYISEIYNIQE